MTDQMVEIPQPEDKDRLPSGDQAEPAETTAGATPKGAASLPSRGQDGGATGQTGKERDGSGQDGPERTERQRRAPKQPKKKRKVGRPKRSEQSPVGKPAEPPAAEPVKKRKRSGPPPQNPKMALEAADASHRDAMDKVASDAGQWTAETNPNRLTDVHALGEELEKVVWSMLENGHDFDETAAYINQVHKPKHPGESHGITLEAVKRYFRGSKQLQARRVKRMQELTQEIKKELVGNPDAATADVIDAIIFTGLMGLDRDAMPAGVSEAAKHYVACQALRMKQRMHNEKVRTERVQRRVMKRKLEDLTRTLKQESGGRALGPETLERIREIYGLFAKPVGPPGSAVILGASSDPGTDAST